MLSVKGMPAACAARQAWISPSPCCMPSRPTGARISGSAAGSPRIVVERSRLRHVDQDALAELDLLQIVAVGAQRVLGIGAAIRIIEERLRHLALVQLAQILDAGDVFHGQFPALLVFAALTFHLAWLGQPQNRARIGCSQPGGIHDRTTLQTRKTPKAPRSAGWTRRWRRGWRRPFPARIRSTSPSRRPRKATITSSARISGRPPEVRL